MKLSSAKILVVLIMFQHEDLSSSTNPSLYSNAYRRQKKSYQIFSFYRRKAIRCLGTNQAKRSYRRSTHTFHPLELEIKLLTNWDLQVGHKQVLPSLGTLILCWMNESFTEFSFSLQAIIFSHGGIFTSILLSCSFSSHLSNSNSCF